MNHYLLSGPQKHWEKALRLSTWGVEPGSHVEKDCWVRIRPGDIAIFYATEPVKGIIGFGVLKKTHISRKRIWNTQDKEHDYECRVPFETVFHVLDNGAKSQIDVGDLNPQRAAAVNKMNPEKVEEIWRRIREQWGVSRPSWIRRVTVGIRTARWYGTWKYIAGALTMFLIDHVFDIASIFKRT